MIKPTTMLLALLVQLRSTGAQSDLCSRPKIPLQDHIHRGRYRIAVHAIRGYETAMAYYGKTFDEYLTATAGQRFDPPIDFDLVPSNYETLVQNVSEESVDFYYANPGSYSCIGVEFGAQPLVTTVSKVKLRGQTYNLDVFAGVTFVRADNKEINAIQDLKDKIVATGSISVIMGGQSQMYEMVKAGMDYVMDPKQFVFTQNQQDVVTGVLDGKYDCGMVRTGQLEESRDDAGNLIDPNLFKVLEPKIYVLDDGNIFPYLHSTDVAPEWAVAALNHVPADVAMSVQEALLQMADHAKPWEEMRKCQQEQNGETRANFTMYQDQDCSTVFSQSIARCDTTLDIAKLSYEALQASGASGHRSPRSYFDVRTMHERAGFMKKDPETDKWKCVTGTNLHDAITCPPGHYKLSANDFQQSCDPYGLTCGPEDHPEYQCYCRPCVRAYEVDVFQYFPEQGMVDMVKRNTTTNALDRIDGCDKMSICAVAEQQETVILRAADNTKREGANVTAVIHMGRDKQSIPVQVLPDYTYQFEWTEVLVGVAIVEISVDGHQIPESPVRVQIVPRTCNAESSENRRPNQVGDCVCKDGHVEIGGSCVTSTVFAITGSIVSLIIVIIVGYFVVEHKNRLNDMVWHVNVDELRFDDPVEIIGEGAFGVVLAAEYRGTKVAIKKAVRDKVKAVRGSRSSLGRFSLTGSRSGASKEKPSQESEIDATSGHSNSLMDIDSDDSGDATPSQDGDEEAPSKATGSVLLKSANGNRRSATYSRSGTAKSGVLDLGFLTDLYGKDKRGRGGFMNDQFHEAFSMVSSGSMKSKAFAAKFLPCLDEQTKREEEFVHEMRLLSSLRHPCICTVMGAVISRDFPPMLVMEFMEYGSLFDLLRNETMYLTGEIILQIMRDVAQGLRYLHTAKPPILHGDLKPANILIDGRFRAKVCDFGLSRKKKNRISGSLLWLAPEYLVGNEDYNASCDMYSMGIILNEIYSRKTPYEGQDRDMKSLLIEICDRKVNKRPTMPACMPPKMGEVVKKLWARDPSVRPHAKELDGLLMAMNVQDAEPAAVDQIHAKPKTQDMLYDLFPRHIAEALKAGKKVEPENHEMVTIIFSDIKGFTDISREISPMKVSMMLDRLYLAFDRITKKHGVFKVETIGDAYMGVCNLVENQDDTHVKRIAEFAIDMINEASKILIDDEDPSKGFIKIRVGFHSGPVVSNVIGSLNPRYGLFGDTVNTASRMESNSTGGRILCSETSYALLKEQDPKMPVVKRGKIAVKGKGDMLTYWVGDDLIRKNKKKRRKENRALKRSNSLGSHNSDAGQDNNKGDVLSQSDSELEFHSLEDASTKRTTLAMKVVGPHLLSEKYYNEHASTPVTEESGESDKSDRMAVQDDVERLCHVPGAHATAGLPKNCHEDKKDLDIEA